MARFVSRPLQTTATNIKLSPTDTTAGSLTSKITGTGGLTFNVLNAGGNEQLQASITNIDGNSVLVKMRNLTESEWTTQNPVLALGEIGVETGGAELKFKIGDGVKTWSAMQYYSSGTTTVVVGTPVVTSNNTSVSGTTYSVNLSAVSSLANGSIASFEIEWWDNSKQTVSAIGNTASTSKSITGTIGQQLTFSVVAVDNFGNKSLAATKTVEIVSVTINTPSITAPTNGATEQMDTFTITASAFGVTNGSDTHASTDWEIWTGAGRTGTRVWSSLANTTNKTSITVPSGSLAVSTTYYIAVRYNGTTYGSSGYASSSFTTAAAFAPTTIGQAWGGGYYAGVIKVGTTRYALIVAPKSTQTSLAQKTTADATANTQSVNDGWTNTNSMNNSSHPAAQYCRNMTAGGYTDWYLPSRDEFELCYRNLKPTTDNNYVGTPGSGNLGLANGTNPNSDPAGDAYTTTNPAQTTATTFRTGGVEAFDTDTYYWTSTEYSSGTSSALIQSFHGGGQTNNLKTTTGYKVRAVRRVVIAQGNRNDTN